MSHLDTLINRNSHVYSHAIRRLVSTITDMDMYERAVAEATAKVEKTQLALRKKRATRQDLILAGTEYAAVMEMPRPFA